MGKPRLGSAAGEPAQAAGAARDRAPPPAPLRPEPGRVAIDDLLLSFEGRIGRGAFCAGLVFVAFAAVAAGVIFDLPGDAFCRLLPGPLLGTVYTAAFWVMGGVLLAMLAALCCKRMADVGWWRIVSVGPVAAAAAFPILWRLEALGPCGIVTAERAVAIVWTGILFVAALALHFLGPSRRRQAGEAEPPPALQAVNSEDE